MKNRRNLVKKGARRVQSLLAPLCKIRQLLDKKLDSLLLARLRQVDGNPFILETL